MNSTVLVALITGGFTIAASVTATLLAQRHASKIADLSTREDRRRDVRALVVELAAAARRWVRTQEIWIPTLYESGAGFLKFMSDYVDTDTGKQLAEDNATIPRVCGELLLMVKDAQLRTAVADVLTLHEGYAEDVNGNILTSLKATVLSNGQGDFDVVMNGLAYVETMKALFSRIQTRSAELLQGDLVRAEKRARHP